ncbi:MAG: hypothetical protein FWG59_01210 [Betaproteobacteria bacterium]|nr:hypothetical protein [Betaproteobacteria bacterium]
MRSRSAALYVPGALGAIGAGMAAGMPDRGSCEGIGGGVIAPVALGAVPEGRGAEGATPCCTGAEKIPD